LIEEEFQIQSTRVRDAKFREDARFSRTRSSRERKPLTIHPRRWP